MSGHTPGPWTYTGSSRAEIISPNVIVMEDDGGCGDPECCGPASYWVEISASDASLISAAPELLDALESVLDSLGALTSYELYNRMSEEEADRVFAALDKARGTS